MAKLLMYIVVRKDLLLPPQNWPLGAVMTQAAHASTAVIWEHKDVVRKDLLLPPQNWPLGAVMTQAAHASTAVIWEHKDDAEVMEYMSDIPNMTKITLQIENAEKLNALHAKLNANNVQHTLWVEQPENIPVCIAVKPSVKANIQSYFKGLKLFS